MLYDDMSIDISSFVDFINIKNLPEIITDYLRSKRNQKYSNLRKFYSMMLDKFGSNIKESYLNRILKYLSSEKPSNIYLIDDINNGIYDKELEEFASELASVINEYDDYSDLYENLNRKINFIFYESEEEYCEIKTYNNDKKYIEFIFYLLKHALKNYQSSIPGIIGKKLLMQAQTMEVNNPTYIRYLNAASLLGNDTASINLYGIICSHDYNTAIDILLRNKESELVLWTIAYALERNLLNKTIIQKIKNKYKYIFEDNNEFVNNLMVTEYGKNKLYDVTLVLAYKLYNYSYEKYDFTKSGNSLGKLLIFDIISYKKDRNKSIELGKKFLKKEILRGNIHSVTNMAIYFYNNQKDNEYNYNDLKKLLSTSASFGDSHGNYYLGKILYDEGDFDKAFKYISFSEKQNNRHAQLLMGRYYELKDEFEKAIKYYKKALVNKEYDAAYYLYILYFKLKNIQKSSSTIYENIGLEYLEKYYNLFSDEVKAKASSIIQNNSENFS